MNQKQLTNFWNQVEFTTDCWNWLGYTKGDGYGKFNLNGRFIRPHRISYELYGGKLINGLQLDHLCRNRKCVNPQHLEQVTHLENQIRGIGFIAKNIRKTHCNRGHELSGDNLRMYKTRRVCRECKNLIRRKSYKESVAQA